MRIDELDTPSLLVDVDAMERNLRKMSRLSAETGVAIRPHFKVCKCVPLVRHQIELGARGVTCAKLGEAATLVEHGLDNIHIAYEIVGQPKIRRLLELRKRADVMINLDSPIAAEQISAAAVAAGDRVPVLVEVDLGMNRCGTTPEGAVELTAKLMGLRGIEFRGLTGYEGHLIGMPDGAEKQKAVMAALDRFSFVKERLAAKGIETRIVGAGGTGDYKIAARHPAVTELHVGTYAVMDTLYGKFATDFEQAATLLCTVVSRPAKGRVIIDVGRKGVNTQLNSSTLKGRPSVELKLTYAEHGAMECREDAPDLQPGAKVQLDLPYACGSIHLHEKMHLVRDGEVVDIWPIAGRGKIQ